DWADVRRRRHLGGLGRPGGDAAGQGVLSLPRAGYRPKRPLSRLPDMVDGLDLDALAGFLLSPGALNDPADRPAGPLRAELIAGGKSNLTYRVTDDAHDWVVRRPPLGHVLATAHDM